jgi:hypothetical protein
MNTTSSSGTNSRDTGGGSSTETVAAAAAAAVLQQEVGRLRKEVSCLRTTLATLYVTCSHLKEVRGHSCKAIHAPAAALAGAVLHLNSTVTQPVPSYVVVMYADWLMLQLYSNAAASDGV